MNRKVWDRPVRLIVQGISASPDNEEPLPLPSFLTSALTNAQRTIGYTVVAEMGDYLLARGINVPNALSNLPKVHPWLSLPSLHLLETEGTEATRVMRDVYRAFGDPNKSNEFVELIELEPTLHPLAALTQSRIGNNFNLKSSGCSHAKYRGDIGADTAKSRGVTGDKTIVAVLDSGADSSHPANRWRDLTILNSAAAQDNIGHGAAMVSIIEDIAPKAEIHAMRVTDSGNVLLWDLMAGIDAAVFGIGAHMVNMSLGLPDLNFSCSRCGGGPNGNRSAVFERRFDLLEAGAGKAGAHDPVFVASVGNDGTAGFNWPAAFLNKNVVAVGAVTHGRKRSEFSNTGSSKGEYFLCPGGEIDTKGNVTEWVGEGNDNGVTTLCVGTSPAAAYASGMLALHREDLDTRGKPFDRTGLLDRVSNIAANDVSNESGHVRLVFL